MLCSKQKTCFVFQELSMLFAVCRVCYEKLIDDFKTYDVVTDFCSFCDKERSCKVVSSFDATMFFLPLKVCDECMEELVEKVSLHDM